MININNKIYNNLEEQVGYLTAIMNLLPEGMSGRNFDGIITSTSSLSPKHYGLLGGEGTYNLYYNDPNFGLTNLGPFPREGIGLSAEEADARYLSPLTPQTGLPQVQPGSYTKINPVPFISYDWTASLYLDTNEHDAQDALGFRITSGSYYYTFDIRSEEISVYSSQTNQRTSYSTTFVSGWCILTLSQTSNANSISFFLTHQLGTNTGLYNFRHQGPIDIYVDLETPQNTKPAAYSFSLITHPYALLGDFGAPADVLMANIPEAKRKSINLWTKDGSYPEEEMYTFMNEIFAATTPRTLIITTTQYTNEAQARRVVDKAYELCLKHNTKLYVMPNINHTSLITHLQSINALLPTNLSNFQYSAKAKSAIISSLIS